MRGPSNAWSSEINVTPFLDVLLVLLVIFLASVHARRTLDVQLPAPARSSCSAECESIVLEVLPDGSYALNRTPLTAAELERSLRATFAGRPKSILFVKGDRGVSYQAVITAIDIARGTGVRVLAIAPKDLQ